MPVVMLFRVESRHKRKGRLKDNISMQQCILIFGLECIPCGTPKSGLAADVSTS